MSTLKADTIRSTGGGAVTLTKQSAAKTQDTNTKEKRLTITSALCCVHSGTDHTDHHLKIAVAFQK